MRCLSMNCGGGDSFAVKQIGAGAKGDGDRLVVGALLRYVFEAPRREVYDDVFGSVFFEPGAKVTMRNVVGVFG